MPIESIQPPLCAEWNNRDNHDPHMQPARRGSHRSNQIAGGPAHQALTEQRTALDLPALKMGFLEEILTNLKGVVDAVPIPQKKHLLHLLVKKVLICDRRTFEVWYRLPQFPGVRTLGSMVAPRGLEPLLPP